MSQLSTLPQQKPAELLKLASQCKKSGDIKNAIRILKEAYKGISYTSVDHGIDVFLKLPYYQQVAGRPEQAWKEYNRLLVEGYPNQNREKGHITMEHAVIYDKMRIFLQRESYNKEAIKFGVFSYLLWANALHYQERKKDLRTWIKPQNMESMLNELLQKALRSELINEMKILLERELEDLPHINFPVLGKHINDMVLR